MQETRREPRISYKALSLPFLGVLMPEHINFQFLLINASNNGIQIAIPNWVVAWDEFSDQDEVKLCMPLSFGNNLLEICKVCWKKIDPETHEQFLGLAQQKMEAKSPLFVLNNDGMIAFADTPVPIQSNALIFKLIKDACFLKRGVEIYLEHFLPYFSRITKDALHFNELREFILEDALKLVKHNITKLDSMLETIKTAMENNEDLTSVFDIDVLQEIFQSEVHHGLFQVAFANEMLLNYVEEIKKLESRLFQNYNSLVILHLMALAKGFS